MMRRTIVTAMAAAAGIAFTSLTVCAAEDKPKNAADLKKQIDTLYAKTSFADSNARNLVMLELGVLVDKDKKDNPLRKHVWWSETIREAMYTGDQVVKKRVTGKGILETEIETFPNGYDKPAASAKLWFRGPNTGYSTKKPAPLLISIVDSKTDPKAYLEKAWAASEDVAKDWVLACIAESDQFNPVRQQSVVGTVLGKMMFTYNVDPNRVYLEGVGAACGAAQVAASFGIPDRLAGLVLRNPAEAKVSENCGLFPVVVVHAAEGGEKAVAVHAKVKETVGESKAIDLVAPDAASAEGLCPPLVEWLKAAAPRELPTQCSWVATFDRNGNTSNDFTGTVLLKTPAKREEPTHVKVTFDRVANKVELETKNLGEFAVWMNDGVVDLDREVSIVVNGTEVSKRVFDRNVESMLKFADAYFEYGRVYPAYFEGFVPAPAAEAPKDGEKKADGEKKDEGEKKEPEKK